MDIATFVVILLVVVGLVGGTVAVVARGAGLWSPPALPDWASPRRLRDGLTEARSAGRAADAARNGRVDGAAPGAAPGAGGAAPKAVAATSATASGLVVEVPSERVATVAPPTVAVEAARLEERIAAVGERVAERLEGLRREVAVEREGAIARQAAVDARQEAALVRQEAAWDRLRADLAAALAAAEAAASARGERAAQERVEGRRAEATADLYARLARLEAALAQVTNPILLPGEPYAPPTEFLDEALVWENWKEVGERAFAFADAFNANRLHLPAAAAVEVAAFVGELRGLLTGSIYPNLRPNPTPVQVAALRAALERLAATLPELRERLATAYRDRAADGG